MKYALILFTHVYAGSTAISIPMQSMDLCQKAGKVMTEQYKPTFTGSVSIVAADCIQVSE